MRILMEVIGSSKPDVAYFLITIQLVPVLWRTRMPDVFDALKC